jgi:hypothetical protein
VHGSLHHKQGDDHFGNHSKVLWTRKMAGQLVCGVKDASAKFKQQKIDNRFAFNN